MFEGRYSASAKTAAPRVAWTLTLGLVLLASGCGSVAVNVDQPPGVRVELCQKAKWFPGFGPDWCTGWDTLNANAVQKDQPVELKMEAHGGWFDRTFTCFPRQYRASFDFSEMAVYPNTPTSVIEVRYVQEIIPPKHQEIVRLWHSGRTLDVLTNIPVDVLADVLYNLGDKFTTLLSEVNPDLQKEAAARLKTMLESAQQPSPKEVESWLKSFLNKQQLDQVLRWVRRGVTLREVKWVPLGGEARQQGVPPLFRLLKDIVELVIRQPEIRSTHVNFLKDVILRDLLVKSTKTQLVNLAALRFYAEVVTYDTTYFSDRTVPSLDLIQDIGLAEVVAPTPEQETELQKYGMTRSVRFDRADRAEAISRGLPPAGLQPTLMTSVRSQVIGALLESEMAYVVIWNNPDTKDPVRFLTTVVTVGPYGMARVWARHGSDVYEASAAFESDPALTSIASWVIGVLDQRDLFVKLDKPIAAFALGNRRIAPWSRMAVPPVSQQKPAQELEPTEKAPSK